MRFLLTLLLLSCTAPVFAQDVSPSNQPVEITADKTLEWHRNKNQYVATGNAMIVQGDTTIRASTITADYRESKATDMEIYRLIATGNVSITSKGSTASGDNLVYDVDSSTAVMTGKALKMTSPDQVVTATESFEYNSATGKLKAIGNAQAVRTGDTLKADTISAILAEGKTNSLEKIEASGNVEIITPTEKLTGNYGVYTAASNTAEITGGVKITRDENVLTGDRAKVDLTTNISTLYGSMDPSTDGGRVRGVFYPDKKAR